MTTSVLSSISADSYAELVGKVFETLKGGNVTLGNVVALGQEMVGKVLPLSNLSLEEKKTFVLDIVQKGVERVEKEVVAVLSDSQKRAFSEQLLLAVSQLKEKINVALGVASLVLPELKKNPFLSKLFGACCAGGVLPIEPSLVKKVQDKVEEVQKKVEDKVEEVQKKVEDKVEEVQKTIESSATQEVVLKILEPLSEEPSPVDVPANTVVEESPVEVVSEAPKPAMD